MIQDRAPRRVLVLGGGGTTGAAWLGALTLGLLNAQVDLRSADEILGTSAGAVLGTWLATDAPLNGFAAAMQDRAAWHASHGAARDRGLLDRMGRSAGSGHPTRAEIGLLGAQASQVMEARPVDEVAEPWKRWLPMAPWPQPLRMVAVNADSGQAVVWHRSNGLTLPEGIAMTTAAPGMAPPVILWDRIWLDGGVRSSTNADLIARTSLKPTNEPLRVLVLAPKPGTGLKSELARLGSLGAEVAVVAPDELGRAVLTRSDPGTRAADPETLDQAASTAWLRTWWSTSEGTNANALVVSRG